MQPGELNVVTGAFGYTGRYITGRLLSLGQRVKTLTGHPDRPNPFGGSIEVAAYSFRDRNRLVENLRGAVTLYNTYWIRFPYGKASFLTAVANTAKLIDAAKEAGVQRFVHISITNASDDSDLPYFKGKGMVEKILIGSGLSYAIIRPSVLFGAGDVLINNIAWMLRRFPLFVIPGAGDYRLQPVFVEDVAEMAVGAAGREQNLIIDAVGPEIFTFEQLVRLIAHKIKRSSKIVHLNPGAALFLARLIGFLVNDVVLTRDEANGLMANLLVSGNPPTGKTSFSEWLDLNACNLGTRYASELSRHFWHGAHGGRSRFLERICPSERA